MGGVTHKRPKHQKGECGVELWLTERETPNLRVQFRIERTLFRERSPYQEVAVVESAELGRMLVLDGIIQTSLRDEFIYHEMLAHVPLFAHPKPERVLVIGGGDGGTVREVLKHPEVKRVHLVEIDELVVRTCREYLPELAGKLSDPRVEIHFTDGVEFVKNRRHAYDVILVDSSDPLGPAEGLFTRAFYRDASEALKKDGLLAVQSESPFYTPDLVKAIHDAISEHFQSAHLYTAQVPTYSTGPWSFIVAAKRFMECRVPRRSRPGMKTRYYSPEVHRAAFALPPYIRERFAWGEEDDATSLA